MTPDELANALVNALSQKDAVLLGELNREAQKSETTKIATGRALVQMIGRANWDEVKGAVDALRYSGLFRNSQVLDDLLTAVETTFSDGVLAEWAADKISRPAQPSPSKPPKLRALEGLVLALIDIDTKRANDFVDRVAERFAGAPLATSIIKWKGDFGQK